MRKSREEKTWELIKKKFGLLDVSPDGDIVGMKIIYDYGLHEAILARRDTFKEFPFWQKIYAKTQEQ